MSKYSPHILFDKCSHFASYVPSYLSVPSQLALPLECVNVKALAVCIAVLASETKLSIIYPHFLSAP